MIVEAGHYALVLALVLSALQACLPLVGAARGNARLMAMGPSLAGAQLLLTGAAFAALIAAYVQSDFSVANVVANSHSTKPMLYKVSAAWGNHEGSLLLWVLILALFGAAVAGFGVNLPAALKARVLSAQGMIATGFFLFIIFTSNLDIYRVDATGERVLNVSVSDDYEHVRTKVRDEIDKHFKATLNRPEILNRIGDNIIVFDFIRPKVALEIFRDMVRTTLADIKETQSVEITVSLDALTKLEALCLADLTNGGRGIRNKVETHLINPLSRALFEKAADARSFQICDVETDMGTTLVLSGNA